MLMKDSDFVKHINRNELNVWNSFKDGVNNFLAITKHQITGN